MCDDFESALLLLPFHCSKQFKMSVLNRAFEIYPSISEL
jgi:hypothetical protein